MIQEIVDQANALKSQVRELSLSFEADRIRMASQVADLQNKLDELVLTATNYECSKPTTSFPGAVPTGKVRWGCSITNNGDPKVRHEDAAGRAIGLNRVFYQANQVSKAVARIKSNADFNRLTLVSFKPPASWADVGAGKQDAWIDSMLRAVDGVGVPVWLAVHHEPEGGGAGGNVPDDPGGAPAWRAMQKRVRDRMNAVQTKNIAFGSILMGWTFSPGSGRNPTDWYVDGIFDYAGVDHYIHSQSETTITNQQFWTFYKFYQDRKLPLVVGEWGNIGSDLATAMEMRAFYEFAVSPATPIMGISCFDSTVNGGNPLTGEPLKEFRRLMKDPRSILLREQ